MAAMDGYDAFKHWRFNCTSCKFESFGDRCVGECPGCGEAGWNLTNTGPIVVSDGPRIRRRNKVAS